MIDNMIIENTLLFFVSQLLYFIGIYAKKIAIRVNADWEEPSIWYLIKVCNFALMIYHYYNIYSDSIWLFFLTIYSCVAIVAFILFAARRNIRIKNVAGEVVVIAMLWLDVLVIGNMAAKVELLK